jgi:acyl-CoA thioesterase-2
VTEDSTRAAVAGPENAPGDLLDLLALEEVEVGLYRGGCVFDEPWALYGGQVAAQCLRAAGLTVGSDRQPHSLHGYFLRPGDASIPTVFSVERDRDGGSYAARRVVAVQRGEVIFNMSASFKVAEEGLDRQVPVLPTTTAPDQSQPFTIPRLFSFEGRLVEQSRPDLPWPERFWARCTSSLDDDPLLHACALTYLSDISTGLGSFQTDGYASRSSIDHALWFHRPARLDEWVLCDLTPVSVAGGRGLYTESLFDRGGRLLATVAQEALFRRPRQG